MSENQCKVLNSLEDKELVKCLFSGVINNSNCLIQNKFIQCSKYTILMDIAGKEYYKKYDPIWMWTDSKIDLFIERL